MELKLLGHDIDIIGVYAPKEDASVQEKGYFIEQLIQALVTIGNRNEIVMMGDFNSRVLNQSQNEVVEEFGEELVNDNGTRLIELCDQFALKILNGYFQHKNNHRYTWTQATKGQQSIIDYIVTGQEFNINILNVRVQRGANWSSDHFILTSRMQIKYKPTNDNNVEVSKMEKADYPKYNLKSFHKELAGSLYKQRLVDIMQRMDNDIAEGKYVNLTRCMHEAAFEARGY